MGPQQLWPKQLWNPQGLGSLPLAHSPRPLAPLPLQVSLHPLLTYSPQAPAQALAQVALTLGGVWLCLRTVRPLPGGLCLTPPLLAPPAHLLSSPCLLPGALLPYQVSPLPPSLPTSVADRPGELELLQQAEAREVRRSRLRVLRGTALRMGTGVPSASGCRMGWLLRLWWRVSRRGPPLEGLLWRMAAGCHLHARSSRASSL